MRYGIRRVLVVLAVVLLAVLATRAVIGFSTRSQLESAREEFERKYGARVPADLAPPPVPGGDNIAPVLLALIEDLDSPERKHFSSAVGAFLQQAPTTWSAEQRRSVDNLVSACGPFKRYRDLADRQRSNFNVDYSQGWSKPLPPFIEILGVARCALMFGRVASLEGDRDSFLGSYQALVNISRAMQTEPILISQLIAIGVQKHQQYLLREALETGALDLETINLLLAIEEAPPMRAAIARGLKTEALMLAATPSRVALEVAVGHGRSFSVESAEKALAYLMEPTGDLIRKATIDNRSREVEALKGNLVESLHDLDAGNFYESSNLRRDQLAPNIEDIMLKAYASDTGGALAQSALEVARDIAVGQTELSGPSRDDPMTGEPIVWQRTEGHFAASAPGAAALWAERAAFTGNLPPVFEWVVIHPGEAASPSRSRAP